MSLPLIEGFPKFRKPIIKGIPFLDISEFYCDTIQGEGANVGASAAFLRMQSCTLHCHWCDTMEVWTTGNPYSFDELFDIMEVNNVIEKLVKGQHLVLTGGSPLLQQKNLILFIQELQDRYNFFPYIEVENECTLWPEEELCNFVSCWNNSPKLSNSGNVFVARYQPKILGKIAEQPNSWFKFVVQTQQDWEEIEDYFLEPSLIRRDQIILMPCGASVEELEETTPIAVNMAIEHNVRFSPRLHINLWNRKTGV